MTQRYKIVEGSQSGHCCFNYTIVDTTRPFMIRGQQYNNEYEIVCECHEEADAKLICDALNENEEFRAKVERLQVDNFALRYYIGET